MTVYTIVVWTSCDDAAIEPEPKEAIRNHFASVDMIPRYAKNSVCCSL